jgi:hypothetical protein
MIRWICVRALSIEASANTLWFGAKKKGQKKDDEQAQKLQ